MKTYPILASLLLAFACSFSTSFAQSPAASTPIETSVETPVETPAHIERLFSKYGGFEMAVMMMTRDEWDIYRAWDGFDDKANREIISARKNTPERIARRAQRKQQRMTSSSVCDCWIEPSSQYTLIETEHWQYTGGAGPDVDAAIGPLALPFDFEFYGAVFDAFFINSKGSVSFGEYVIDWTPEEFPDALYDQIAGFWADADYRATGEIWYNITPDAVYVNFVDVGYYNLHDDRTVSYQIIFTETDGTMFNQGNVQLCYLDMGWAHGDVGGGGGCCGPTPATVGADAHYPDGDNIQFGRFNFTDDSYNGPYGGGPGQQDGVYWLSNKNFIFSTVGFNPNVPPIATFDPSCENDVIVICQNDSLDLNIGFMAPEPDQTITITVDDTPGMVYNGSYTEGAMTYLDAYLVGGMDNLGLHTISITATDDGSPVAETVIQFVVEVVDAYLPDLTVTGEFSICSGQETTISCNDDFDNYVWSLGCIDVPECTYNWGSTFSVVAGLEVGCSTETEFTINQSLYFLPCVDVMPNPICGDDTSFAVVCGDTDTYVEYEWDADWNGAGGEIIVPGTDSVGLIPGSYRLLVTDEFGCQGQRVFNVEQIEQIIPDITLPSVCDSLYPVTFDGAFQTPDAGPLLIYLVASTTDGWGGESYLEIIINGTVEHILTSFEVFVDYTDIEIEYGDDIEINFITSPGAPVDDFSVTIYNCSTNNEVEIDGLPAGGGTIFSAEADCIVEPVGGSWNVSQGAGWFTNQDEFNTTFTPTGGFGMYELCFTDDNCGYSECFEMEVTTTPVAQLLPESTFALCDGEDVNIQIDTLYQGSLTGISWPGAIAEAGLFATYGPTQVGTYNFVAEISNACGQVSLPFEIEVGYTPEPELEDVVVCDEGSEVLLDPGTLPEGVDIVWTHNDQEVGQDDFTWTVTESGTWCIEASTWCGTAEACAEIEVFVPIANLLDTYSTECTNEISIIVSNVPEDWTVTWPDGSVGISYASTDHEEWVVATFVDPLGCTEETDSTYVWIGDPVVIPGASDPFYEGVKRLCPEIMYTFEINSQNAVEWSWSIDCDADLTFLQEDEVSFTSAQLPEDCWYDDLVLTGTAMNPCTPQGLSYEWHVGVENCDIKIPNIFTPGNGSAGFNDTFEIGGLLNWGSGDLHVFNRWGQMVFEDLTYQNDWLAADMPEGAYYYTLRLPNGRDFSGYVHIKRE